MTRLRFLPCQMCGSSGPCKPDCGCRACTNPADYRNWRMTQPDQYLSWVKRQAATAGVIQALKDMDLLLADAADDDLIDLKTYIKVLNVVETAFPHIDVLLGWHRAAPQQVRETRHARRNFTVYGPMGEGDPFTVKQQKLWS